MKHLPAILVSVLISCLMFSAVLYSSCNKADKCENVVCQNGGRCMDGTCVCAIGYVGAHCEKKTDRCTDVQCLNGGVCQEGSCLCPYGYSGPRCEISACQGVVCQNGGHCRAGLCECKPGYEGTNCEIVVRDKFLGNWHGYATSCKQIDEVKVVIEKNDAYIDRVWVDFTDFNVSTRLAMTAFGKNIYMSGTQDVGNAKSISFSMTVDADSAMFSYDLAGGANGTVHCSGTVFK